jgi:hypothetical protein
MPRQIAANLPLGPQGNKDAEEKAGAGEKAKIARVPAEAGTQSDVPPAQK